MDTGALVIFVRGATNLPKDGEVLWEQTACQWTLHGWSMPAHTHISRPVHPPGWYAVLVTIARYRVPEVNEQVHWQATLGQTLCAASKWAIPLPRLPQVRQLSYQCVI